MQRPWRIYIVIFSLSVLAGAFGYQLVQSEITHRHIPADIELPVSYTVRKTTPSRRRITRPSNATLCLAQNLYFEARHEPYEGKEAVAATVFNRMSNPLYPSSICAVVYQYRQYSWTLDSSRWSIRPPKAFLAIASEFIVRREELRREWSVTHFHRHDLRPDWSRTLIYVTQIGAHVFYRM
jgi:spore germination cell wall hydrolase CwlJ-like protein